MKWFLLILVFVASSFITSAQELSENWYNQADTAYVEKDSVVGIAKGKSIDWNTSKSIAFMDANFQIMKLLELRKMSGSTDIIAEKTFLNRETGVYTYHVAIKIKKPYQLKIKQVKFKD